MSSAAAAAAAAAAAGPSQQQPQQPRKQGRRASRSRGASTLAALLHALVGRKLMFELRNDTLITGRLASTDDYLNSFVDDALWQPVHGPSQLYPQLFIRGRNLRIVHLPKSLDAGAALDQHVAALKKQRVAAALQLVHSRHERLAKGVGSASAGDAAPQPEEREGDDAMSE